mgnify:CR=1 FL=1
MKADVYIMTMLGLAIGLYLFGFTSPLAGSVLAGDFSLDSIVENFKTAIFTPLGMSQLLFIAGFAFLPAIKLGGGSGTGFAVGSILQFYIPLVLIYSLLNFIVFPIVPIVSQNVGFEPISLLLTVVFNAMLTLTILEFVGGR